MEEFEVGRLILNLLLVFLLVLLNGVFVAAEFSLVKMRQSRLTQLVSEGNRMHCKNRDNRFGIILKSIGHESFPPVEPAEIQAVLKNMFNRRFSFDSKGRVTEDRPAGF